MKRIFVITMITLIFVGVISCNKTTDDVVENIPVVEEVSIDLKDYSLLPAAFSDKDIDEFKSLLEAGASTSFVTSKGHTLLHMAFLDDDLSYAKALLEAGVELYPDLDDKNNDILYDVVENSEYHYDYRTIIYTINDDAIDLLLEHGLDLSIGTTRDWRSIMHYALAMSPKLFRKLVDHDGVIPDPISAMHYSITDYGYSRLEALEYAGIFVTDSEVDRYDILKAVLTEERPLTFEWLIGRGYNVLEIQEGRESLLLHFLDGYYYKVSAIKWLLEHDVDPDTLNENGVTSLWDAVKYYGHGYNYYISYLINYEADPNYMPDDGENHTSMLYKAIHGQHKYLANSLIQSGADPNYMPDDGEDQSTLLQTAVINRQATVVKNLLEYGAVITNIGSIDLLELAKGIDSEIYAILKEYE